MIIVTGIGLQARERLEVLVGEWILESRFPGDERAPQEGPRVLSRFEWALDRQFLLQRTEIPVPEAPDSLGIIGGAGWEHDFTLTYRRAV